MRIADANLFIAAHDHARRLRGLPERRHFKRRWELEEQAAQDRLAAEYLQTMAKEDIDLAIGPQLTTELKSLDPSEIARRPVKRHLITDDPDIYQAIMRKLLAAHVGDPLSVRDSQAGDITKADQDRRVVTEALLARTEDGEIPVFVTADVQLAKRLLYMNRAAGILTSWEIFPDKPKELLRDGFQIEVEGRRLFVQAVFH